MGCIQGINALSGQAVEIHYNGPNISRVRSIPAENDMSFLSPGWLDLQVNGWKGVDWNSDDLTVSDAEELCRNLAKTGTMRFLATVITAPQPAMASRMSRIMEIREKSPLVRKHLAGIHVEGPFISEHDGPRGAHDPEAVRNPSTDELSSWRSITGTMLKLVTLAPEIPGAAAFIRQLNTVGIVAAIGHSSANAAQIRSAITAGARYSTHLGNGIAASIPRHDNPLWEQIASPRLTAGLISDGHHLPDAFIRSVSAAKGSDRIVLTSDAALPGGLEPGDYSWMGRNVRVENDGHICLSGTAYLAGAGHLLNRGLENYLSATQLPVQTAILTVTRNPAELIKESKSRYSLETGSAADIVAFQLDSREDCVSGSATGMQADGPPDGRRTQAVGSDSGTGFEKSPRFNLRIANVISNGKPIDSE